MSRRLSSLAVAGAAAFGFAAAHTSADTLALARVALCGAALAVIAAIDLAEHRVPNRVVLPAAAASASLTAADGARIASLAWSLVLIGVLLVVSLARPAALGMGDVKLTLLIATGLDGRAPAALIVGVLLAALGGVVLLALRGGQAWRRSLPLAPFLASGALAAILL
jgi:leader peptidase (prepilin peptidase)/N-methyltransferase